MNDILYKLDKIIIFFIIYTLFFLLFFSTLPYTLPFVLALIFAILLNKPTEILIKKFNFKNSIASLTTTIIFFTFLILILILGITTLTQEAVQLGKSTQIYVSKNSSNIHDYIDALQKYYNNLDPYIINTIQKNFSNSLTKITNITVNLTGKVVSYLVSFLAAIPYILMVFLFTFLATYFFTKDICLAKNKVFNMLNENNSDKIYLIYKESKKMLSNYFISYLLIIGLTFIETLIVFLIFRIKYSVILSLICAVADILPILGIGFVYIPLCIIYIFFIKNYVIGIGLLLSYLLVSIIRQILEPKIVSSSVGLHPVSVLAALFIGLKSNGISGILFCMLFIIFLNVLRKVKLL